MKQKKLLKRSLIFLLSLAMVFTTMLGTAFAGEVTATEDVQDIEVIATDESYEEDADLLVVDDEDVLYLQDAEDIQETAEVQDEVLDPEEDAVADLQDAETAEDAEVVSIVDKDGSTIVIHESDLANITPVEATFTYGENAVEAAFYPVKDILANAEFDTSAIHGLAAIASDKFTTGFASDQLDDVYIYDQSKSKLNGEAVTATGYRTAVNGSAGNKWASDIVTIRVVAEGDHAMFYKKGACKHYCAICGEDEEILHDEEGNCLHKYAYCGEELAKVVDIVDKDGNTVEIHECELANITPVEATFTYGANAVEAAFYPVKDILANAEFDTSAIHGLAAIASDKFTTGFASDQLDDVYIYDQSKSKLNGEAVTATGYRTAVNGSAGNKWASDIVTIRVVAEGDHAMFYKKGACKHYCAICEEKEAISEEPVWTWDGFSSAKAAFNYVDCGETAAEETGEIAAEVTLQPAVGKAGEKTYTATVTYNEKTFTDTQKEEIPALEAVIESDHNYPNSYDNTWTYTKEGATAGVLVTFDAQTKTENNYDFIYLYDGEDNEIGKYTNTALAGVTVYIPTATFKIRLTSDGSSNDFGFAVTAVEAAVHGDLVNNGSIEHIAPIYLNEKADIVVKAEGKVLVEGTDYDVAYDNTTAGTNEVKVTGKGEFYGVLTAEVSVVDQENLLDGPEVKTSNISLRMVDDNGSSYLAFSEVPDDWFNTIESVTLTPVNKDGSEYAAHPYKAVTLTKEDLSVRGNNIYFNRTAEKPVVYVEAGHDRIDIRSRWSTNTYNSQDYKIEITSSDFYKNVTGTLTYYTGTSPDFSIIVDADGDKTTTDDQTVVKTWSADEINAMAEFANGSSQCGMTGFRTFSGMGVSLVNLLKAANVEVSDSDYFLLDTSDHYGNNFTYEDLFGVDRYFLSTIYEDGFYEDVYSKLVEEDDQAGATMELRKHLAAKALEADSKVLPRINVNYVETMLSGETLKDAVLPTKDNTSFNSLVAYENQYRYFYGIKLVQDDCKVTFDTQGGSAIDAQTVKSHYMTSTENTTMKSSYWANSLVIYRGAGEAYKSQPSAAADTIAKPADPTKYGYTFAGWYKDAACTDGNEFDFAENDGTVDQDTTVYAKWVAAEGEPSVVDYSVTNAEHDDADAELNQTILINVKFNQPIKLLKDDLSEDLEILIAGGNVKDTDRTISYAVDETDSTVLVIKLVSTGWVAVYNGKLNVNAAADGIQNIVSAADGATPVKWNNIETYIPIGIEVANVTTAGTADTAASTEVTVTHKANMRGMYHFQLLSNGVPVECGDTTYMAGVMTSHAHNFYGNITKEAIAAAMASAITSKCEGYSAVVDETDATKFVVKADKAVAGEVLTVQMYEYNADGRTNEALIAQDVASAEQYLNGETAYSEESAAQLQNAINELKALAGTNADPETLAKAKSAVQAAIKNLKIAIPAEGVTVAEINAVYSGEAFEPEVAVKMGEEELVKDTDYTVTYSDNINAGTAKVTVTGTGKYGGSVEKTFTIAAKKVTPAVTLAKTSYVYNGKAKKPAVTVKVDGQKLAADAYTVSYASGRKAVGSYKVTVKLQGNYSGSKATTFKITQAKNTLKAKAKAKTLTVKAAKVKSKAQTIKAKNAFKVTKAKGKVTYKKASGTNKITVSKTGKITIKKGLKKGTYKVKVKVTAKGNKNFKKLTKTVTLKIKVK